MNAERNLRQSLKLTETICIRETEFHFNQWVALTHVEEVLVFFLSICSFGSMRQHPNSYRILNSFVPLISSAKCLHYLRSHSFITRDKSWLRVVLHSHICLCTTSVGVDVTTVGTRDDNNNFQHWQIRFFLCGNRKQFAILFQNTMGTRR